MTDGYGLVPRTLQEIGCQGENVQIDNLVRVSSMIRCIAGIGSNVILGDFRNDEFIAFLLQDFTILGPGDLWVGDAVSLTFECGLKGKCVSKHVMN